MKLCHGFDLTALRGYSFHPNRVGVQQPDVGSNPFQLVEHNVPFPKLSLLKQKNEKENRQL